MNTPVNIDVNVVLQKLQTRLVDALTQVVILEAQLEQITAEHTALQAKTPDVVDNEVLVPEVISNGRE